MDSEPASFPPAVSEALLYYVYRLIDPRNGETFYVGKGQGDRVFAHARDADGSSGGDESDSKAGRIREIKLAGLSVGHVIHRHGMDAATAFAVEAALIDAYPGLSNLVGGHDSGDFGPMHAIEAIARYQAEIADFRHKSILISVNRSKLDYGLYEAVRFAWRLDVKKARQAELVLATVQGVIRGAFVASRWMQATARNFPERASVPNRWGFEGGSAPAEVAALYVNKRVPDSFRRRGAANPVRYSWLSPADGADGSSSEEMVGDTGFEPVTSAMSTQRSNHLS